MTNDTFKEWFIKNYPANTIIGNPEWHVDKLKRAVLRNQPQEAVAVLIADPMFLPALNVPLMDWKVDVTNLPIGTELYTSQPNDKAEIARLREALKLFIDNSTIQTNHPFECEHAEIAMKGE